MTMEILKIVKDVFKNKNLKIEKMRSNKLKIYYINSRGNNPKPFTFYKYLDLDENLAEAIGIYLGDGKFASKDEGHIDIVSIDSDITKFMLKFFLQRMNVNLSDITFVINYTFGNPKVLKEKWSRLLEISEEEFLIQKTNRNKSDSLRIQVNGKIFCLIFKKLIESGLPSIKSNSNLRRAFLRGHFAADGGIGISKDVFKNYIVSINFNYNPKNEKWLRDYIIECLKFEGIMKLDYKEYYHKSYIQVTNWVNYIKFWKMGLFERCYRKRKQFLKVVKEMTIYFELNPRFRYILFDSLNKTQKEIAKLINSWQGNVSKTIRGNHLLRIDQIMNLLNETRFSWSNVIENTTKIRIGNQTYLQSDNEFLNFVLSERNLI